MPYCCSLFTAPAAHCVRSPADDGTREAPVVDVAELGGREQLDVEPAPAALDRVREDVVLIFRARATLYVRTTSYRSLQPKTHPFSLFLFGTLFSALLTHPAPCPARTSPPSRRSRHVAPLRRCLCLFAFDFAHTPLTSRAGSRRRPAPHVDGQEWQLACQRYTPHVHALPLNASRLYSCLCDITGRRSLKFDVRLKDSVRRVTTHTTHPGVPCRPKIRTARQRDPAETAQCREIGRAHV